jgi:outer membrane protein TolC
MKRRGFLWSAIFLSVGFSAEAAEVYTLKELFMKAEKNAALQKEFNALRSLAEAKLGEAQGLKFLPELKLKSVGGVVPDATYDPNNLNNYRSKDFENDFSFSGLGGFWRVEVEGVQPIYTFGKISNALQAARGGQQLADSEEKKRISEVRLLVKKAYYTIQLSNDSIEILKDVEAKLNDANEKVEELLIKNAENVSEIDRLKIRVFSADVKSRSLDADRAGRLSRSALAEMAGLSGDWSIDPPGLTAEKPSSLEKQDAISAALRSKPDLVQLNKLIEIKEAEARAQRANLYPNVFVAGQLEYAVAPGRTDVKNPYLVDQFNFFNVGVVLGLTQDLNIYRTLKKSDSVDAEVERLRAQRDQLSIKTKLDAERSFEEAISALQAMKINEEGFRAARSWLTSTGLSFNLGTSETKEVLESFAAFFKARVDLMRSVYNLNLALAELSAGTGLEVLERLK